MSVEIRPVEAGDVDEISVLARLIWNRHYPGIITQEQIDYMLGQRYAPGRLLEELASPGVWWDQALLDGARAGFAATLRAGPGEHKLDKLYVHPDVQRRGVGGALIAHACERARADGCTALILAVNKQNAKAIAAYRKNGFAIRESVRVDIGSGFVMDDYVMAKGL